MPNPDQLLNTLQAMSDSWRFVAFLWHLALGFLAVRLASGFRLTQRGTAVLFGLLLFSCGAAAWLSSVSFNGDMCLGLATIVFVIASTLPAEKVNMSPGWIRLPGLVLILFGWFYPQFMTRLSLTTLIAAPVGILPCPTLILMTGTALILDGLGSRLLCTILGLSGLFYGLTGVFYLQAHSDWTLVLGAGLVLFYAAGMRFPVLQPERAVTYRRSSG